MQELKIGLLLITLPKNTAENVSESSTLKLKVLPVCSKSNISHFNFKFPGWWSLLAWKKHSQAGSVAAMSLCLGQLGAAMETKASTLASCPSYPSVAVAATGHVWTLFTEEMCLFPISICISGFKWIFLV